MHFTFFWLNWGYRIGIISAESLGYQEAKARTEVLFSPVNSVNDWNAFPTLKLYDQKLSCSLNAKSYELYRGINMDVRSVVNGEQVKTIEDARLQMERLNHPGMSESSIRSTLPKIKRESGPNTAFILTHIDILESSKTPFRLGDEEAHVYPIALTVDDLLLNPEGYICNNKLYGFDQPITAATLLENKNNLEDFLEKQDLVTSVREYIISDFGNVLNTSAHSTFRTKKADTVL
jgi:hypothetical protein